MRIHVPLEFLDTLGVNRTANQTGKDFSNCLLNVFTILSEPTQPAVWRHLLSNTCFDIGEESNTIQSNGAIVTLGVDKLQELMSLPPQDLVNTIQQILENNARLSLSQILGQPFAPTAFEVVKYKRLPSYDKILNTFLNQQAYHAMKHGWTDENITYTPTPSDDFNKTLKRTWGAEDFDEIVDFYVNSFVKITENDELSGAFQLRFFLGEMFKKLTTVAPQHMLDDAGLKVECKESIANTLASHPKMSKYAMSIVAEYFAVNNTIDKSWSFLHTIREEYLEIQNLKTQFLMDPIKFWGKVRDHCDGQNSQHEKDMLVQIVVNNYKYPKRPLTDRIIAILSQSSYVLKQLFDAGVLTTNPKGHGNFVDAEAKKYSAHSLHTKTSIKDKMVKTIEHEIHESKNYGELELQSAQDLLNIFQRTTLSEHIGETFKTSKRKI